MAKFRKKPVVINAMRWAGANKTEAREFFGDGGQYLFGVDGSLLIATLEGTMRAEPGDWIIRGIKGEFYPCKSDIFAATYEPAIDPAVTE